jgi:hypothetical protein
VSKQVTLLIPYRGKTREIPYIITDVYGTNMQMTAKLRAKRYPCAIPRMETFELRLNNEFPNQELIKKIKSTIK